MDSRQCCHMFGLGTSEAVGELGERAKHLDIDAHPTMAARPRTGVAAKLSRVLAPPPNG
jgi:hypothetical protein